MLQTGYFSVIRQLKDKTLRSHKT